MPTPRRDDTRYVFGSHRSFRKVTVYSRLGPAHAKMLAEAELDRRLKEAGREAPVSHELYVVSEPAPDKKQLALPGLAPAVRKRARPPKWPPKGWPFPTTGHTE